MLKIKPEIDSKDIATRKAATKFYQQLMEIKDTLDYNKPISSEVIKKPKKKSSRKIIAEAVQHLEDNSVDTVKKMMQVAGVARYLPKNTVVGQYDRGDVLYAVAKGLGITIKYPTVNI